MILSFKPKTVTKSLLTPLSERACDIVVKRYGLGNDNKRRTLESIGKEYDITRERVRQVENHSILTIVNSEAYERNKNVFNELKNLIGELGGVISEEEFLNYTSSDKSIQNHVHFLLVLGEYFHKEKENDDFKHRWHIDHELSERIHNSLRNIYQDLSDEDLISEPDLIKRFLEDLKDVSEDYKKEEMIKRWLSFSKKIDRNILGEWGRADSPNIKAKGIRDYAFLVLRKEGSPVHFKKVADLIQEVFNKKAHSATTHNELIKDSRFVLVGRGLYALSEWGYKGGVVKDIIKNILEKNGPLSKDEIIKRVLEERYVKENTIIVNLQNSELFEKLEDGRYDVVK